MRGPEPQSRPSHARSRRARPAGSVTQKPSQAQAAAPAVLSIVPGSARSVRPTIRHTGDRRPFDIRRPVLVRAAASVREEREVPGPGPERAAERSLGRSQRKDGDAERGRARREGTRPLGRRISAEVSCGFRPRKRPSRRANRAQALSSALKSRRRPVSAATRFRPHPRRFANSLTASATSVATTALKRCELGPEARCCERSGGGGERLDEDLQRDGVGNAPCRRRPLPKAQAAGLRTEVLRACLHLLCPYS